MNEKASKVADSTAKMISDFEEKYQTQINDISAKLDEKSQAIHAKYSNLLETVGGKSDKRVLDLQKQIEADNEKCHQKIQALSSQYENAVASIHEKYEEMLKNIDSKNDGRIVALTARIDEQDKKSKETICQVQ